MYSAEHFTIADSLFDAVVLSSSNDSTPTATHASSLAEEERRGHSSAEESVNHAVLELDDAASPATTNMGSDDGEESTTISSASFRDRKQRSTRPSAAIFDYLTRTTNSFSWLGVKSFDDQRVEDHFIAYMWCSRVKLLWGCMTVLCICLMFPFINGEIGTWSQYVYFSGALFCIALMILDAGSQKLRIRKERDDDEILRRIVDDGTAIAEQIETHTRIQREHHENFIKRCKTYEQLCFILMLSLGAIFLLTQYHHLKICAEKQFPDEKLTECYRATSSMYWGYVTLFRTLVHRTKLGIIILVVSVIEFLLGRVISPPVADSDRELWPKLIMIITYGASFLILQTFRERNSRRFFLLELSIVQSGRLAMLEKERIRTVVATMLPREVLHRVGGPRGSQRKADVRESASILQFDVVNFTRWCSSRDSAAVVQMVSRLVTRFDAEALLVGAHKLKTIGDAYQATTGLLGTHWSDGGSSAVGLFFLANRMHSVMQTSEFPEWTGRIGIATGQLMGTIVGSAPYRYDVFGEAAERVAQLEPDSAPEHTLLCAASDAQVVSVFPELGLRGERVHNGEELVGRMYGLCSDFCGDQQVVFAADVESEDSDVRLPVSMESSASAGAAVELHEVRNIAHHSLRPPPVILPDGGSDADSASSTPTTTNTALSSSLSPSVRGSRSRSISPAIPKFDPTMSVESEGGLAKIVGVANGAAGNLLSSNVRGRAMSHSGSHPGEGSFLGSKSCSNNSTNTFNCRSSRQLPGRGTTNTAHKTTNNEPLDQRQRTNRDEPNEGNTIQKEAAMDSLLPIFHAKPTLDPEKRNTSSGHHSGPSSHPSSLPIPRFLDTSPREQSIDIKMGESWDEFMFGSEINGDDELADGRGGGAGGVLQDRIIAEAHSLCEKKAPTSSSRKKKEATERNPLEPEVTAPQVASAMLVVEGLNAAESHEQEFKIPGEQHQQEGPHKDVTMCSDDDENVDETTSEDEEAHEELSDDGSIDGTTITSEEALRFQILTGYGAAVFSFYMFLVFYISCLAAIGLEGLLLVYFQLAVSLSVCCVLTILPIAIMQVQGKVYPLVNAVFIIVTETAFHAMCALNKGTVVSNTQSYSAAVFGIAILYALPGLELRWKQTIYTIMVIIQFTVQFAFYEFFPTTIALIAGIALLIFSTNYFVAQEYHFHCLQSKRAAKSVELAEAEAEALEGVLMAIMPQHVVPDLLQRFHENSFAPIIQDLEGVGIGFFRIQRRQRSVDTPSGSHARTPSFERTKSAGVDAIRGIRRILFVVESVMPQFEHLMVVKTIGNVLMVGSCLSAEQQKHREDGLAQLLELPIRLDHELNTSKKQRVTASQHNSTNAVQDMIMVEELGGGGGSGRAKDFSTPPNGLHEQQPPAPRASGISNSSFSDAGGGGGGPYQGSFSSWVGLNESNTVVGNTSANSLEVAKLFSSDTEPNNSFHVNKSRCDRQRSVAASTGRHHNRRSSALIQLQCGIHYGPITTTVMGINQLNYDVYGTTVNGASRVLTVGCSGVHGDQSTVAVSEVAVHTSGTHAAWSDPFTITAKGLGELTVRTSCISSPADGAETPLTTSLRQRKMQEVPSKVLLPQNDSSLGIAGAPLALVIEIGPVLTQAVQQEQRARNTPSLSSASLSGSIPQGGHFVSTTTEREFLE